MFFPPKNWSRRFGTQFFTLLVDGTQIVDDGTGERHANYIIIVKRGKQEKRVRRRYSEFHEYHRLLVRLSTHARRCTFPPKTWFRNLSDDFLSERKQQLEKYLQNVLCDQRIARHHYTISFLKLNDFRSYPWWDFNELGYTEEETNLKGSTDDNPFLSSKHTRRSYTTKNQNKENIEHEQDLPPQSPEFTGHFASTCSLISNDGVLEQPSQVSFELDANSKANFSDNANGNCLSKSPKLTAIENNKIVSKIDTSIESATVKHCETPV